MRDQLDLKQIAADLERQAQQHARVNRILRYVFWGLFIVGGIGPYLLLPGLFLLPQIPLPMLQSIAETLDRLSGVLGVLGYAVPVAIIVLLINGLVNTGLTLRRERARANRANAALPALAKLLPDLPDRRIPTPVPWFNITYIILFSVSFLLLPRMDNVTPFLVITIIVFIVLFVRTFYWRWEARWLYHGPLDRADYEGALKRVNTGLRFFPRHIRFLSASGFIRFLAGDEYEPYYRNLLTKRLTPYYFSIFLSTVGRAWLSQKRYDDAFILLETAIRISPDDPGLYSSLADYYSEKETDLERAMELVEYTSPIIRNRPVTSTSSVILGAVTKPTKHKLRPC